MSFGLITDDVNFGYLFKIVSARFSPNKVDIFSFVINE